jgi:hypothetical protein
LMTGSDSVSWEPQALPGRSCLAQGGNVFAVSVA